MSVTLKVGWSQMLMGFLWTCLGGCGPAAVYLWNYLWTWKIDYPFEPKVFAQLIASGAGPLALAWWYKHQREVKALLRVPEDTQEELEALREIKEEYRKVLTEAAVQSPLARKEGA